MTVSGFLPRRWRPTPEIARHAEAIAGVLHTAPLEPAGGGPAVISLLGTADVLPYLVAIKSLYRRIGRASFTIVDDGTLTGEDRAILAHHCGDPEILPQLSVRRGPFPPGGAWALLLTIVDRRGGQYWIALDPHTVTRGPVPEIVAAIASNRSFAAQAGIAGFAAGGAGRGAVAAKLAELGPVDANTAVDLILAKEPQAIELPRARYAVSAGGSRPKSPAVIHFPAGHRFAGDGYAMASAAAIAEFAR